MFLMKIGKLISLTVVLGFIISSCCKKEAEPYGPFQDLFPVEFNFDTIVNVTSTRIFTSDGVDQVFSLPEREYELNVNMNTAKNQVDYIKLLSPDQSEIKGKQRDGVTEVLLDAKYTLSGSTYTFTKDIFVSVLKYNADRVQDTMTMKGISCLRYNNGNRETRSTVVQVTGYTLEDEKAQVDSGDTLYYRIFDIQLVKKPK